MSAATHRALLVGCGQLGGRHLQALAGLPEISRIEVVDPNAESLAMGRQRLAELPGAHASKVRWLSSLTDASPSRDLCVIATLAAVRGRLLREVAQRLDYRRFLLEKLVAQSAEEMERLVAFARAYELAVWVNCKARAYPFYLQARARVRPEAPILLSVIGGNHGLANNGVHAADLFAFFDGGDRIELGAAQVDPILHPSKRGAGLFDLSGTLVGTTARGSRFVLSFSQQPQAIEQVALVSPAYRFIADPMQRWAMESDEASGWSWRPAAFEGELLVSQMTTAFAREILAEERCGLPSLEQSLVAHRFILSALQPFFSQLMERRIDACPVT